MAKTEFLIIKGATIRSNGPDSNGGFCIFLPWNSKKIGKNPDQNEAARFTKETGIKFRYSATTDRIYTIAKLLGFNDRNSVAHEWSDKLLNGHEWQVTALKLFPNESFSLIQMPDVSFHMRNENGTVFPVGAAWPDFEDFCGVVEEPSSITTPTDPYTIKNIIFSDPCTIVFWGDGTKTIVRCGEDEHFDPEKGIAMALMKKVYGPRHKYMKYIIGPYLDKYYEEEARLEEAKAKVAASVGGGSLKQAISNLAGKFSGKAFIDKVNEAEKEEQDNDER